MACSNADAKERVLQKGLGKKDKIFVMCRSGGRSAKAEDALTKEGFALDKNKMYLSSGAGQIKSKVDTMLNKLDANGDGHLSAEEFTSFHKK